MTSEMVRMAHYDVRDGQKKFIMPLEIVKKAHYAVREGQKGSYQFSVFIALFLVGNIFFYINKTMKVKE